MSVISWVASVRPAMKGTVTSWPASCAAFSTPAHPASTTRSAKEIAFEPAEALNDSWMPSRVLITPASWSGALTVQPRCGSRRSRPPLAPPRLSLPRKVEAAAQAVETSWETVRPLASRSALSEAMSASSTRSWSTAGTGSCHSRVSAGTSGPR